MQYEDMQDFQKRVVDEKQELDSKIESLDYFFGTEVYQKTSEPEANLLHEQHDTMNKYSLILGDRIKLFK